MCCTKPFEKLNKTWLFCVTPWKALLSLQMKRFIPSCPDKEEGCYGARQNKVIKDLISLRIKQCFRSMSVQ